MGYPPHPHRNLVNIALDWRSDISKYLTNSGEIEILKILLEGLPTATASRGWLCF
jgi:hypothetical protein